MINDMMLQKDALDETLANVEVCKEICKSFSYMLTKNNYVNIGAFISLDLRCLPLTLLLSQSIDCKYILPIHPMSYCNDKYKLKWGHHVCLNKIEKGVVLVSDIIDDHKCLESRFGPLNFFKQKRNFEILCLLCIKFNIDKDIGFPVLPIIEKRERK